MHIFVAGRSHSNVPNNQKALCCAILLFLKMSHFHNTQTFELLSLENASLSPLSKIQISGKFFSECLKIGLSAPQLKSDWVDSLKHICINFAGQASKRQARKSQIQCGCDKKGGGDPEIPNTNAGKS